jgi:uncharacterized protein YjbJ (UPF0337 family)
MEGNMNTAPGGHGGYSQYPPAGQAQQQQQYPNQGGGAPFAGQTHGLNQPGHDTQHAQYGTGMNTGGATMPGSNTQGGALPATGTLNDSRHPRHGRSHMVTGKVEHAIGSMIGSNALQAKGLQKQTEANSFKQQGVEIAEAERLEHEALKRRERAVNLGAHPENKHPATAGAFSDPMNNQHN